MRRLAFPLLALAVCAVSSGKEKSKAAGNDSVEAGRLLFSVNCAACHQPGGVGKPGFAPGVRNPDFLDLVSDEWLSRTILAGRPGTAMVGRPDLAGKPVADLVAYLRTTPGAKLRPEPPKPPSLPKGEMRAGAEKFAAYCAACHGLRGEGYLLGLPGPSIGKPGFLLGVSDGYLVETMRRGRRGTAMRSFAGPEGLADLRDRDFADLVAYLRGLTSK